MTRKILVDGDSLARSPESGRLSPSRLGATIGALLVEVGTHHVDLVVLVSHSFGTALTQSQRGLLERATGGSLVIVSENTDLRDFLVAAADDGHTIIVSNNAFARQTARYPWLTQTDSGRHVLARPQRSSGTLNFVEARYSRSERRRLRELISSATPESDSTPTFLDVVTLSEKGPPQESEPDSAHDSVAENNWAPPEAGVGSGQSIDNGGESPEAQPGDAHEKASQDTAEALDRIITKMRKTARGTDRKPKSS